MPGGSERSHSVRAALAAARPTTTWSSSTTPRARCVTPELVAGLPRRAGDADAAIAAAPVTDTIKECAGRARRRTLDRSRLWAVQTPQVFRRDALQRALDQDDAALAAATDDASLVEAMGGTVRIVPSPPENLKVTTALDLRVAEMLLRDGLREADRSDSGRWTPSAARTASAANPIPVNRSVLILGTKSTTLATVRPIWCPATDIPNVMTANRTGASHGEYPARPRAAPPTTLSTLSGSGSPYLAHFRSGSARSGEITARPMRNRPYAPRPIIAMVSAVPAILLLRKAPMTMPISGATPSQSPKIADVLTDCLKVGLSPPSTSELRKLSRLSVSPSESSPNIR